MVIECHSHGDERENFRYEKRGSDFRSALVLEGSVFTLDGLLGFLLGIILENV